MVRGIANGKIGFGDLILLLRYFFKLKVSTHPNVIKNLFEIANLDQRDPAELLGVLLKTAEIDPNDMKWQIWKELGQEILNQRKIN